ncbi:MAG: type II secretion system protein GspG [Acidobacteriota bacterium]
MREESGRSRAPLGLTVIELLLLLGVIAVIAAIVLPNLMASIQRSRQKRTMSDMRSIGTGLGSYQVDFKGYPSDRNGIAGASRLLHPGYIVNPPTRDAWRHRLRYEAPAGAGPFAVSYTLTSAGMNLKFDGYQRELCRYFSCDIIYNDGQFVQSPEGIKKASDMPVLRQLDLSTRRLDSQLADATWARIGDHHRGNARLGPGSRDLMRVKAPSAYEGIALARWSKPAIESRLERTLAADMMRGEYLLHSEIHRWFLEKTLPGDVETLDERVYAELFLAPRSDPWNGLVPRRRLEEVP